MDVVYRHATRPYRISVEKIEHVKEHISSFPWYESHYSRSQNPHVQYLHPDLSISRMITDPVSKQQLKTEWVVHKAKAKQAYDRMKEDEQRAINGEILMLTFDLQQALPTPSISTSIVFYLRQLWTY